MLVLEIKRARRSATIALWVNILLVPGVGSILGKRYQAGVLQLSLYSVGWIVIAVGNILGVVIMWAAWMWGIRTGILLRRDAAKYLLLSGAAAGR